MSDHLTIARMLDDSFQEFDRLMQKAIEEIHLHSALAFELESLVGRHAAARAAGSAFVVEAAWALHDLKGVDSQRSEAA